MPTEWDKKSKGLKKDTEFSSELLSKETKQMLKKESKDIGTLENKNYRPEFDMFPGE